MNSKRILIQIEALRHALKTADGKAEGSFADVFNAFLDVAEAPGLFGASKPVKPADAKVRAMLEVAARKLTGDTKTRLRDARMLRVASAAFLHGGFFAGPFMGTFFFFEKEQQGLAAFYEGGDVTHLARLTVTEMPEGAAPMPGPGGVH